MSILKEMIQQSAESRPAFVPTMTKDEYKALKKDEYATMWETINQQAETVLSSGVELYRFLQAQARNPRMSANNVLYLQTQRDDFSMLKTFDQWKDIERSVRKNEKSLRVIVGEEYQREDGKENKFFTTKPFFDVSQTEGRPVYSEKPLAFDQSKMLAAMIHAAHDKGIEIIPDNEVPPEICGTFQEGAIHIRDDMELRDYIFGLALGSIAAERDRRDFSKSSSVEICSTIVFCEAAGMPIRYDANIEMLLESVVMDAQNREDDKFKRNLLVYSQKSAKTFYEQVDYALRQDRATERQQEAPAQEARSTPAPEQGAPESAQPAEWKKASRQNEEPER